MENISQRYSLAATVNYSTFLPIPEACTIDKKNILQTSIEQNCCCSYLASRPSNRYKKIVDYYYQDHVPRAICYPRIFPEEGHTGLVFSCNPQKPEAFLVGTPTSPRDVDYIIPGGDYFIVFFCFGMHHALYPIYGTELTDKNFSIDEITSGKSGEIVEKIILAATFQKRILIFEEFLEEHMPMFSGITPEFQYIVSLIRNNAGILKCERLINCNLYTERHIRRLFDKYIGIPPRLFSNMNRYYKITRALATKPYLTMSRLATEFGYYDQAHFINEFKRFLGFTPNQFTHHLTKK